MTVAPYQRPDTAYAAVQTLAPLDGETARLLWRLITGCEELADRLITAREAAGYGPGQEDTHVITRNRLSRPPVSLRTDGTIADVEVVAIRRTLANTRARIRTLVYWLEDELAVADPNEATAENVPDARPPMSQQTASPA